MLMTRLILVEPVMPRTAMKPTKIANTAASAIWIGKETVIPNWLRIYVSSTTMKATMTEG